MKTHIQYTIYLKCKLCNYKNTRTLVFPIETRCRIGCSQCKESSILFVVAEYASWSTHNSDIEVKIIK